MPLTASLERGEDEVPCHRGADGDLRGLEIANFADHDDVRILPENGTQAVGKSEPDVRLDVDLAHSREAIFHGFFDGDDAPGHGVDRAEEAIEAGRFPEPVGP